MRLRHRLAFVSGLLLAANSAAAEDFCGGAAPIIGNSGYAIDALSTFQFPNLPVWSCGGTHAGGDWFTFTVPLYVTEFTVDTCLPPVPLIPSIDTRLEVLRGDDCSSLSIIACNDDASCGLRSSITITGATSGETYFIRVGGYNGATGVFGVQVTHPPSIQPNECSAAYPLAEGVDTAFSNIGSSTSPPAWPCALGGSDIWFTYTAPSNTEGFFVSTRGSMYDTATQIFTGNCNALTSVSCNDDYNGLYEGGVFVHDAVPNQTYLIRIGGYDSQTGNGTVVAREFRDIGTSYCASVPTATGSLAVISGLGSDTAMDNAVTIRVGGIPPNQFGLFVASRDAGFVPPPLSNTNGNLCLSGVLGRFNTVRQADASGQFSLFLDTRNIPQGGANAIILAGETWRFQAWFRDPTGAGSNFTNGLELLFD